MGEIIDITKYFRTCQNCVWWAGPEAFRAGHGCKKPGGWRAIIKGLYNVECGDFVNIHRGKHENGQI